MRFERKNKKRDYHCRPLEITLVVILVGIVIAYGVFAVLVMKGPPTKEEGRNLQEEGAPPVIGTRILIPVQDKPVEVGKFFLCEDFTSFLFATRKLSTI